MSDIVERLREWPHGHKTMIVSEAIDEIERLRAALAATPAVGGEPVAWLYEMAFAIKPSADPAFTKWKQVVTLDPPPTIPKDGVRNVSPLYAAQPASPLRGRETVRSVLEQYWFWDEASERHREMLLDELSATPPEQPAAAPVTERGDD